MEVDLIKSPLVRQTSEYALTLIGSIAADTSGGAKGPNVGKPPIVGVYMSKMDGSGAAKFLADGTIITSSGSRGTWSLFDADTGIYVVELRGRRLSLKLAPGRGLVSMNDQTISFELQR